MLWVSGSCWIRYWWGYLIMAGLTTFIACFVDFSKRSQNRSSRYFLSNDSLTSWGDLSGFTNVTMYQGQKLTVSRYSFTFFETVWLIKFYKVLSHRIWWYNSSIGDTRLRPPILSFVECCRDCKVAEEWAWLRKQEAVKWILRAWPACSKTKFSS